MQLFPREVRSRYQEGGGVGYQRYDDGDDDDDDDDGSGYDDGGDDDGEYDEVR